MLIAETERLRLRWLTLEDTDLICHLLNDPDWKRFIFDRGHTDTQAAQAYLTNGPLASYARQGHGLYHCELKETGQAIGLCGLIQRPGLEDMDLGFALLPAWRSQGYAQEAAQACLDYGRQELNLKRILAITDPQNQRSADLLIRLGFQAQGLIKLADQESLLFSQSL